VDGFPSPKGATMMDKRAWAMKRADRLRRMIMHEPRGHADMVGAVLIEPVAPGSDAGVLFLHHDGFGTMSGHGIIAVTTIALERGLLMAQGGDDRIVFDTPAGTVRVRASHSAQRHDLPVRIDRVSFANVPSFVLHAGIEFSIPGRRLRADVAYGGAFYAIVDAESAGVPLNGQHLGDLRRLGAAIADAVHAVAVVAHPLDPRLTGVAGTIFTAPAQTPDADLRNVAVSAGGAINRSPSGTGTSAVMAVLDAMGFLSEGRPFVHESLTGATFEGRVTGRTRVGDLDAIVPEISGAAWITGEHTFLAAPDDPLAEGVRLS
jgi:proline racemase